MVNDSPIQVLGMLQVSSLLCIVFKGIAKEIGRDLYIYLDDHPEVIDKRDYS